MTDVDNWDNSKSHIHTWLKYKGTFNWRSLMKFMRAWCDANHYVYYELFYKEKPGNYGTEIRWYAKIEKKIDGFYRHFITWQVRIWDNEQIEVIKDGKKVIMDSGRIRIYFNTIVELDYEGHFEKSSFHKKLESFLRDHILVEEVNAIHWDGLYYEMMRFKNEVEAQLNMETATVGSPYH